MNVMKKIFAIAFAAVISASSMTGCGCNMANNAASTVSQVASDAVSGAGRVVDDVGSGASNAVSGIADNTNGNVSDDDGIIGNETQPDTEKATDSTEATTMTDTTM